MHPWFLCLLYFSFSFLPIGLPYPGSISGLLPCLIVSYFVRFDCYLLEACSFSEEEMGGEDLEKRGGVCWKPRRSGMRGNCDWDVLNEGRLFSTKH